MEFLMKRTSDMSLLVFGIVLAVIGAVMRFAVEVTTKGFNIHTAGVIMLVVGILASVVALVLLGLNRTSRSTMTERILETPTGQVRTEERSDSSLQG